MKTITANHLEDESKGIGFPRLNVFIFLLVLAFGLLSFFSVRLVMDSIRFPVSEVQVVGDLHYADRETLQAIVAFHADSGFYGIDLPELRESVEALPWIRSASIRRLWPNGLKIDVKEHDVRTRWNKKELVSSDFSVFMPPQYRLEGVEGAEWEAYFSQLPLLGGVEGRHAALYELYRVVSRQLVTLGAPIVEIHEDERRSVRIVLENGIWINLGRERTQSRLQLFSQIYKRVIEPEIADVIGVDMRYPNGFSVKYVERGGGDK